MTQSSASYFSEVLEAVSSAGNVVSQADSVVPEELFPVIDSIVHRRCRGYRDLASIREEVRGEVVMHLLRRLQSAHADDDPIHSFQDYAATVTWRVVDDWIRRRFPRRTQLKNRVLYLLHHDDRFLCGTSREGETLCSLAPDTEGKRRRHSFEVEQLAGRVIGVLEQSAHCEIDDLVNAVSEDLGIFDFEVAADDMEPPSPTAESPLARAETSDSVRFLWREILQLPFKQRVALLLSIRDEAGNSPLAFLPAVGTSMESIRAALAPIPFDAAFVLNRLPMQDSEIAAMLHATRQQVINFRKAARDRLRRRFTRSSRAQEQG